MAAYVALLRGINVSGQKLIKMADLQRHFASCGAVNVRTYIQSGNVVFEHRAVAATLQTTLQRHLAANGRSDMEHRLFVALLLPNAGADSALEDLEDGLAFGVAGAGGANGVFMVAFWRFLTESRRWQVVLMGARFWKLRRYDKGQSDDFPWKSKRKDYGNGSRQQL